ncbi:MAG: hypothetical protein HC869_07350 [Rhodospirillales bacterium]|nr:hypothetical protein [Rhodospirillales bacterium]
MHVGSLAYLQSAKAIADDLACDLFVLTGPSDAELRKHAQKGQARNVNRPLSFAERQLLLSTMLAISPVNILVHQSTPHHGDPDLQCWVDNFSVPLVSSGVVGESDIISGAGAHLLLTVVIKKSDFKVYRQGDQRRHYAHYLREKYRGLDIMNLSRTAAERTEGRMRPESDLPSGSERYAFIPPNSRRG